jgi:predicted nucleic acid-binding protein
VTAYDALVAKRAIFVTSSLRVAEMHALIVRERGSKAGCDLLDAVYADPLYQVTRVDRDLETAAADLWLRKFEQRFSLTDAVSFEIMRHESLSNALALDHHFEAAGYNLIPALPKGLRR